MEEAAVEPQVGDRILFEGRMGTVVQLRRYQTGQARWLVLEYDSEPGQPPVQTWIAWSRWQQIEILPRAS